MRLVVIEIKQDLHDLLSMSGSVIIEASNACNVLNTSDPSSKVKFLFLFTYEPLQSF